MLTPLCIICASIAPRAGTGGRLGAGVGGRPRRFVHNGSRNTGIARQLFESRVPLSCPHLPIMSEPEGRKVWAPDAACLSHRDASVELSSRASGAMLSHRAGVKEQNQTEYAGRKKKNLK